MPTDFGRRNAAPGREPRFSRIIEGEAVLVAGTRRASPVREPAEPSRAGDAAFGRGRPAQAAPDLVFPSAAAARMPPRAPQASLLARAPALAGRPALFGATAIALALILPAVLIGSPEPLVAAPYVAGRDGAVRLSEVATAIFPRGQGAVLSVEGLLANRTDASVPVPPVEVRLTMEDGRSLTRLLHPMKTRLGPGETLRVASTLALPRATKGTVSVDLMPGAPGRED